MVVSTAIVNRDIDEKILIKILVYERYNIVILTSKEVK